MQRQENEKWEPVPVIGWGLVLVFVAFLAGLVCGRVTGGEWEVRPGAPIVKHNRHTGQVLVWRGLPVGWESLGPRE